MCLRYHIIDEARDLRRHRGERMKKLGVLLLGCALALTLSISAQKKKDGKGGDGDAKKGEAVFKDNNCAVCHNADKETKKIGPGLKGLFTHTKMWDDKPLTEANV